MTPSLTGSNCASVSASLQNDSNETPSVAPLKNMVFRIGQHPPAQADRGQLPGIRPRITVGAAAAEQANSSQTPTSNDNRFIFFS
jgi:hypothetical protein